MFLEGRGKGEKKGVSYGSGKNFIGLEGKKGIDDGENITEEKSSRNSPSPYLMQGRKKRVITSFTGSLPKKEKGGACMREGEAAQNCEHKRN